MLSRLADSHLHLQDIRLADKLDDEVGLAVSAGISLFLCNACDEKDWADVLSISRRFQQVIPFLGVHPWYVKEQRIDWYDQLRRLLVTNKAGVGEIGLDRYQEGRDERLQEEFFRAQLSLARELKRPVSFHCLRAYDWVLAVLKSEQPLSSTFMVHGFGSSKEIMFQFLDRGAYISFSGTVLGRGKERLTDALKAMPDDRLLIETDAPDMAPSKEYCHKSIFDSSGKQINMPENLALIAGGIAELRGVRSERLAEQVWNNSERFAKDIIPDDRFDQK